MIPIHKSKIFWTLISGLLAFVTKYYLPEFPLSEVEILALVYFVLNLFKIKTELMARGLLRG